MIIFGAVIKKLHINTVNIKFKTHKRVYMKLIYSRDISH